MSCSKLQVLSETLLKYSVIISKMELTSDFT